MHKGGNYLRIKSAVDWWLALIIWLTIGGMIATAIFAPPDELQLLVYATIFFTVGFMLWLYYGTYYEFQADILYCRAGPFVARVPYNKITSIRLSNNPLSSMALSVKRIEIKYKSTNIFSGLIYISPPDRENFMRELISRAPNLS